jgi:hypothetical protein
LCCDDMILLRAVKLSDSLDSNVVGFSRTGRKNNFSRVTSTN